MLYCVRQINVTYLYFQVYGEGYLNMTVGQRKDHDRVEAARVESEFSALLNATASQVVY